MYFFKIPSHEIFSVNMHKKQNILIIITLDTINNWTPSMNNGLETPPESLSYADRVHSRPATTLVPTTSGATDSRISKRSLGGKLGNILKSVGTKSNSAQTIQASRTTPDSAIYSATHFENIEVFVPTTRAEMVSSIATSLAI